MATSTETKTDNGIKKVINEAVTTVQGRLKDVEKVWNDAFAQINTRVTDVNKDARDFVKRVEEDGRKRIETLRTSLKAEDLFGRTNKQVGAAVADATAPIAKLLDDAIDRMGLLTPEELKPLDERLTKLAAKIDSIRRKTSNHATKASVTRLDKRLAALEKAVAELKKKA